MTQIPGVGDRIRLVAMDDPDPISPGAVGTVASVERLLTEGASWLQIEVDWDNGRALMLVSPPDRFEIVSGGTSRTTVAKARGNPVVVWSLIAYPDLDAPVANMDGWVAANYVGRLRRENGSFWAQLAIRVT